VARPSLSWGSTAAYGLGRGSWWLLLCAWILGRKSLQLSARARARNVSSAQLLPDSPAFTARLSTPNTNVDLQWTYQPARPRSQSYIGFGNRGEETLRLLVTRCTSNLE